MIWSGDMTGDVDDKNCRVDDLTLLYFMSHSGQTSFVHFLTCTLYFLYYSLIACNDKTDHNYYLYFILIYPHNFITNFSVVIFLHRLKHTNPCKGIHIHVPNVVSMYIK